MCACVYAVVVVEDDQCGMRVRGLSLHFIARSLARLPTEVCVHACMWMLDTTLLSLHVPVIEGEELGRGFS